MQMLCLSWSVHSSAHYKILEFFFMGVLKSLIFSFRNIILVSFKCNIFILPLFCKGNDGTNSTDALSCHGRRGHANAFKSFANY